MHDSQQGAHRDPVGLAGVARNGGRLAQQLGHLERLAVGHEPAARLQLRKRDGLLPRHLQQLKPR
eukprot:6212305-Pleurochrysis_carterae.AAC.1